MRVLGLIMAMALSACASNTATQHTTIASQLPDLMDAYGIEGFGIAIVSGDEIVLARGYGVDADGEPFTGDTPCALYSATKALTSFAVASTTEDGALDLSMTLGEALPDAPAGWAEIPLWRLLNHTSGMSIIVNRPEFAAVEADTSLGHRDVYAIVRELPMDFEPGAGWRYNQAAYAVFEMVQEAQNGRVWPGMIARHVTNEALLASGDREAALAAYRQALAVDPNFENAATMIARIEAAG